MLLTKKTWLLTTTALVVGGLLSACGAQDKKLDTLDPTHLTVGVTGGSHEEIMQIVKAEAAKDGLTIDIKVFSDYNTPNTALAEGSLDLNSYQTLPFLDEQKKAKGFKITEAFKTVAEPMAIYAKGIKNIADIKEGDRVAVPNDPSNELRALKLFEQAGLIKLKEGLSESGTKRDIVENRLNLDFQELPAAQLPTQLPELVAAAINGNYAMNGGLTINNDAIFKEEADQAYPNYVVARDVNLNDPTLAKFKDYYQSDAVRQFIAEKYQGSVVPLF
ncbi:MetQ/NlpA family ABC transporter substrate-binding protein [Neisseriaceae bacterium CLB008]|nr:MetQ/NlpA family ABC transporter substrate-binding protein [Neisseriaceae bacterium]